jgi:undecaprenyl-diphosphatase
MTFAAGFLIGLAQVLALIPGTSRSGITMTAGRFLGFERVEAARFSLLLSIPAILGAGSLAGYDLYHSGNAVLGYTALVGAALAFGTALIAIVLMMGWLKRASFTPFVVYRILLGAALLWWVYGGA